MNEEISKDLKLSLYVEMLKIRLFEETQAKVFVTDQEGFTHLYIGEEAIAAGVCANLNKDDYITSTHRGHGHMIAKGGDMKKMMAELYGRIDGYCKGKSGSLHIADFSIGVLGANGIVSAGIPIATGAGYSAKLRGTKQVAVAFFGDGATTQGGFHEAVNMAAAFDLPVIFIIENNMYLVGTRFNRVCKVCDDLAVKAAGYGMPGYNIDGNDVLEVYKFAKDAIRRARDGLGPTLINCRTYRHHTHFEGDVDVRDEKEVRYWLERDPIKRMEEELLREKIIDPVAIKKQRETIQKMVDDAVDFARRSPKPAPEVAFEDLFV
ncbi:MAG: thiamine pyrophosphate-dependent dehydrogenase E1 component subunit alpha [Actinobacteria bacterium]|nr:thiamine pyrophosphate-dependent dehydrogenase E1 component subunit alpha [Actinomycetota bacterium]